MLSVKSSGEKTLQVVHLSRLGKATMARYEIDFLEM
jgi:hypothetical protein